MIGILKLLMLFSGEPMAHKEYLDVCNASLAKISLEQKIEISIGCSTYDSGRRVYSDRVLTNIYNRHANFSK